MNKKGFFTTVCLCLLLGACGPFLPTAPPPTATLDPCNLVNLPSESGKVNALMRQFDDYSTLAFGTPQSQLLQIIPQMQDVRRAAEDQGVPACLNDLKQLQLVHMQVTLDTLMAFQANRTNAEALNAGIEEARKYHDQYTIELGRLLGVTVVVPPSSTPGAPPPAPEASATAAPTSSAMIVTNPGPAAVNLRAGASPDAAAVGTLEVGQSAKVFAKSPAGDWLLIEPPSDPGHGAWAYAPLLQLSGGDAASIPVVTPSP
jgi:hypothetical protein